MFSFFGFRLTRKEPSHEPGVSSGAKMPEGKVRGTAMSAMSAFGSSAQVQKSAAGKITSLVGAGAIMEGLLEVTSSIHVSGSVKGGVVAKGSDITISMATGSLVDGVIKADSVIIGGYVKGVVCARSVRVFPGGVIDGDVYCDRLSIDEGGRFSGRSNKYEDVDCRDHLSGLTFKTVEGPAVASFDSDLPGDAACTVVEIKAARG